MTDAPGKPPLPRRSFLAGAAGLTVGTAAASATSPAPNGQNGAPPPYAGPGALFGARGDGRSADADQRGLSEALAAAQRSGRYVTGIDSSYWGHPQDAIFVPPGTYDLGDLRLSGRTPHAALTIWAQPGSVVIRIPDNEYLFVCDEPINWFHAYGITFVGGKGVLHHRYTGGNVAGQIEFDHCIFDNYTECAIGNNADDAPYLRVRDCSFMARANSGAIGIAWGGLCDNCIIEGNAFLRNRYHVKLGPRFGGNAHVIRNDFLSWGSIDRAADLWLVPDTTPGGFGTLSGWGTIIASNKFGNENLRAQDARILIAVEGPGTDRQTRHHSETFVAGGARGAFVSGISILNSAVGANGVTAAPFIRSYIAELRRLHYAGNQHVGGRHTWLCEFMGERVADYANMDWSLDIDEPTGSPFQYGVANAPVGPYLDPNGTLGASEEAQLEPSGGDDTSFRELARADRPTDFLTFSGAQARAVTDAKGRLRAVEITSPGEGAGVYLPLVNPVAGRQSRLAIDIRRGSGAGVKAVTVEVFNVAQGITAYSATFLLASDWRRLRIPFTLPAGLAGSWQLRVRPAPGSAAGSFCIGRAYVYHGREAMRDGDLRTLGDGRWDGGHLVMGRTHIWVEGNALYLNAERAPTSPTDGIRL
jgi:hypothetical protein